MAREVAELHGKNRPAPRPSARSVPASGRACGALGRHLIAVAGMLARRRPHHAGSSGRNRVSEMASKLEAISSCEAPRRERGGHSALPAAAAVGDGR